MGIKTFQHKCMSWSTRNLGTVQRTQIIKKTNANDLLTIQKTLHVDEFKKFENGLCHPPKKAVAATELITNMLTYSLRKKNAYLAPEYSVTKPATSSDSDSGRSKGVLFVSARALMKNITN